MSKEALRYISNAKETLQKSPMENNIFLDKKYVKSAFGIAYLGILEAINDYLLSRGVSQKELPKKIEEYEKALRKHASIHNGKLTKEFDALYEELHIAGYYRGLLIHADVVKLIMKNAELFIKKLSKES